MIKQLIYICYLGIILAAPIIANDSPILTLQSRFNKIKNLYVHFIYKISDLNKNVITEYQGELWIKRPNLFCWHVIFPEENFLVSDGTTLWFYVPTIKQVIAYWVKNISDNVFFTLISGSNISIYNNYNIHQEGDFFYLKPINNNVGVQEYKIKITNYGLIEQFSLIEKNEQYIDYYLSEHNNNEIDISKFHFNISEDMQLDDQRK